MTENERLRTHYTLREGWLCLDFANTNDWHASAQPEEKLTSFAVWVDWGRQRGVLSGLEAQWLTLEGQAHPEQAEQALQQATALREAIFEIFSAVVLGQPNPEAALSLLNQVWAEKQPHLMVVTSSKGFAWEWSDKRSLDWMLGPIARSAMELLTSAALARVGRCHDDRGCGWLYLDQTRNKSRRWCSMESCGNRAKVLQHYRKHKTA
ncbi:ABATE domain-containing protein [uncultured Meiothermus sp.]|jgi:predicted RNA-binding Zn ribbon-like protein|uniref:CGNR zinc finger domain-containing protein n=1 Tax=uncultured Meiothermus sp. TaxID=157471 RepID=UPI00261C563E|nr:ABATE domain-containing protein [uncultured Meiothermus sp.]